MRVRKEEKEERYKQGINARKGSKIIALFGFSHSKRTLFFDNTTSRF
jgi:hypothetical protein